MENRQHVIGDGKSPVYICKKGDVPKLFNDDFWFIYKIWYYNHNGFGLPYDVKETDPDLIDCLCAIETHYRNNFSVDIVIVQYLETLIKLKNAELKARAKRK